MSLNQITLDQVKPWLNIRCNNLTVDGTITGGGIVPIPSDESVTVRGVIPTPIEPTSFPKPIEAILPPSMIPVPDSWYSLQYLVFLKREPSLAANIPKVKLIDVNVVVYVDADFRLTRIGTNEWASEYPGQNAILLTANYSLPVSPVPPLDPYTARVIIQALPGINPEAGMPYDYAFIVSDARRLV
jgi:hypothetical protein